MASAEELVKACRSPAPAPRGPDITGSVGFRTHIFISTSHRFRLRLGFEKHGSRNLGSRMAHLCLKNPISADVCRSNPIFSLTDPTISRLPCLCLLYISMDNETEQLGSKSVSGYAILDPKDKHLLLMCCLNTMYLLNSFRRVLLQF